MRKRAKTHRLSKWNSKLFSAALMILVIVMGIVICLISDALEEKLALRKDYSFNKITTLSKATNELLEQIKTPINIYVISHRGEEDFELFDLLTRYQGGSEYIKWEHIVPYENPIFIEKYLAQGENLQINGLIIEAPEIGRYRVVNPADYVVSEYSLNLDLELRYQYEKIITESILFVASEKLSKILLTLGHGEKDNLEATIFYEMLLNNGYDLAQAEKINKETLVDKDLLILLSPKKDMLEEEVLALIDFLEEGKSVFITLDPLFDESFTNLENFYTFMRAYGILPIEGMIESEKNKTNPWLIEGKLVKNRITDILHDNGFTNIVLPRPLGFYEPKDTDEYLKVENLLLTDENAFIKEASSGVFQDTAENQDGLQGAFALALLSTKQEKLGQTSRIFAIGTSLAFTDIDVLFYSDNEALMHVVLKELLPEKEVSVNISSKQGHRPNLKQGGFVTGIILVSILPLVVILAAGIILLPRKYF